MVFYCSRSDVMVMLCFQGSKFVFFDSPRWVNMVFHVSMSCFHDPRWILMVINVSRLVFSLFEVDFYDPATTCQP